MNESKTQFISASIAFNLFPKMEINKASSHYRHKSIQPSSTFFFRLSLVGLQNHKRIFATTCVPWSVTFHVYIESCHIIFFEEAKFHLCISLGSYMNGNSRAVWSTSLKKMVGGMFS
jgi:hypothetical protein